MVYRGRPSTGCKTCRRRKIKCDERPEGCAKCADKGYQCPGYELSIDRIFQDESAAVERKAQKAKAKAIIARDERERVEKAQRSIERIKNAIGVPLLSPMIDQGITFFMMHYASGMERPPISSAAYNKHLSTFGFPPIVATVMTALGLAGTANIFMDRELKREATTWYLKALKLTNKALTKPVDAKADSVLLATMLLSVFEATHNERSFLGWMEHVSGSASLIRMRGLPQFETPAGRRMYMQTVGLIAIQCMGKGVALPGFLHDMNKEIMKWELRDDPGNRFFHIHIDTIDFRAHILNHQLTDFDKIVERGLELDDRANRIFEAAEKDWQYEVIPCDEGTPGIFGQEYHVYPHLAAAQTWNWIRYIRIYIHDIIRNSLIAGFSTVPPIFVGKKYTELLVESTETLYRMQADIFASMPQYLHDTPNVPPSWNDKRTYTWAPTSTNEGLDARKPSDSSSPPSQETSPETPKRRTPPPATASDKPSSPKLFTSNFMESHINNMPKFTTGAIPTETLPIMRVSGGYSTLWALFIAGATPIASPESQAFVLRTLERVSTEFGINQAKVFASALRTKIELEKRGISAVADEQMLRKWDAGWYMNLGERQRITIRNVALKGGVGGVAPIYMPRVGPHLEFE